MHNWLEQPYSHIFSTLYLQFSSLCTHIIELLLFFVRNVESSDIVLELVFSAPDVGCITIRKVQSGIRYDVTQVLGHRSHVHSMYAVIEHAIWSAPYQHITRLQSQALFGSAHQLESKVTCIPNGETHATRHVLPSLTSLSECHSIPSSDA